MTSSSSQLSCNPVGRRGVDDGPPQPQTATCCTALQRGFAPDGLTPPRYAPVRTPASAAALTLLLHHNDDDHGDHPAAEPNELETQKKKVQVRKCKSTVDDQLSVQPRQLRRSGAVRRDWSFEDLRSNKAA